MTCAAENAASVDQSHFWDGENLNWEAHRIGWAIAGGCAVLTLIITTLSVGQHCRSYTNPAEQRQILRILYMPAIYAIISFFSYRFFRSYTYYSLVEIAYEAITLSAFLLLIIEYVAATASGHDAHAAIERKDKSPLPIPFCCWRYRPTKAYFMYTVKWSVLQYVIIRPACSVAGIICEKMGVLCEAEGFDPRYARVYIEAINFVSISIALYGLLLFYDLMKDELHGRRPLAKFLSIKLIVMFTFYQSFVFTALEGHVIHETQYWTVSNIKNGLNALAICIEMVFFSILMWWAYTPKEYKRKTGEPPTSVWRPLWDSINLSDFAAEISGSFRFFIEYLRGKPHTRGHGHRALNASGRPKMDFGEAFGVRPGVYPVYPVAAPMDTGLGGAGGLAGSGGGDGYGGGAGGGAGGVGGYGYGRGRGGEGEEDAYAYGYGRYGGDPDSDADNIRLSPYTYAGVPNASSPNVRT
ncbi:hypothetical protein PLEOSDRAFT_1067086 [Pleurotus ostreatus PC15]|uniref:DUF300-domain-containing protein n=1 Tax=Pleurotus ostreatus (strain PC15) TaxID=1137138 RepID=A0A067NRI1_PLEO1|nr:hypothetical protein PLEOSDRAFT_1067086 [Pleurotus ostreatus PC15]